MPMDRDGDGQNSRCTYVLLRLACLRVTHVAGLPQTKPRWPSWLVARFRFLVAAVAVCGVGCKEDCNFSRGLYVR